MSTFGVFSIFALGVLTLTFHQENAFAESVSDQEMCEMMKASKVTETSLILPGGISIYGRKNKVATEYRIDAPDQHKYWLYKNETSAELKMEMEGLVLVGILGVPSKLFDWKPHKDQQVVDSNAKRRVFLSLDKVDEKKVKLSYEAFIGKDGDPANEKNLIKRVVEANVAKGSWSEYLAGNQIELVMEEESQDKVAREVFDPIYKPYEPLLQQFCSTLLSNVTASNPQEIELQSGKVRSSELPSKLASTITADLKSVEVSWAYDKEYKFSISMDLVLKGESKANFSKLAEVCAKAKK